MLDADRLTLTGLCGYDDIVFVSEIIKTCSTDDFRYGFNECRTNGGVVLCTMQYLFTSYIFFEGYPVDVMRRY